MLQDTGHLTFYSCVTLHGLLKKRGLSKWGRIMGMFPKALPVSNYLKVATFNPGSIHIEPLSCTVLQDTEFTGRLKFLSFQQRWSTEVFISSVCIIASPSVQTLQESDSKHPVYEHLFNISAVLSLLYSTGHMNRFIAQGLFSVIFRWLDAGKSFSRLANVSI